MTNEFDRAILDFVREHLYSPAMHVIMTFFTYLGEAGIFWLTLGIVLLFFKRTRICGAAVLISVALTFLIGEFTIKNIVQRLRPFLQDPTIELLIKPPSGYSFPSGHTGSSFAAATAIFLTTKDKRKLYGIIAYITAALIAFSRIYHHVHFPTDVLAGMVLGSTIAALVCFVIKRKFTKKDAKIPPAEKHTE